MLEERLVSRSPELLKGIRVIYTDLDGTMLGARASFLHDPGGNPTLEPTHALLSAQEAGIAIVPASGRALRGLITDGRLLNLPDVIAEMGAQISYGYGRDIVENYGDTPEPGPPARVMEELGVVDLLLRRFEGKLEPHLPWSAWRECTQLFRGQVDTDEVDAVLEEAGHTWLELHDNGRLHGPYLGLERGAARAYHLQPRGVSKGAAVALDLGRRELDRGHAVAIGDAVADLTLASEVGVLVLVRQAVAEDADLAARAAELENVLITDRDQNLGWADTVRRVAERAAV